jgi:putative transposase
VASFDYQGLYRYFLTFCTKHRRHRFTERAVVDGVLRQFRRAAAETKTSILAYCFMPDHVHLLVQGLELDSDGLRFIKLAKQFSGYWYSQTQGRKLWQRYCYERVLRDNEGTASVARYILENPVRAGLAVEPLEYPFLGSDVYPPEQLMEIFEVEAWCPEGAASA